MHTSLRYAYSSWCDGFSEDRVCERYLYCPVDHFPLARKELRSIKNGLICVVAVICRTTADLGADDEKCYALNLLIYCGTILYNSFSSFNVLLF